MTFIWRGCDAAAGLGPRRDFWTWPNGCAPEYRAAGSLGRRGVPIVVSEPSCLAMLVDDYLDLVPGDAARQVAAHAVAVDAHLASIDSGLQACADSRADPGSWPLPPESDRGDARDAGRPGDDSRVTRDGGRLGLLRHGRVVRLRALRSEHGDRRAQCFFRPFVSTPGRSSLPAFPVGTRSSTARVARRFTPSKCWPLNGNKPAGNPVPAAWKNRKAIHVIAVLRRPFRSLEPAGGSVDDGSAGCSDAC